jgi:hypothetical protein
MSNIVILSGSPRRGATTDKADRRLYRGGRLCGKTQFTLFNVSDMKIGGCLGCGHCFRETGVCIQKDDMQVILDALRKADISCAGHSGLLFQLHRPAEACDRPHLCLLKSICRLKRLPSL